jgi:hypothetical protein
MVKTAQVPYITGISWLAENLLASEQQLSALRQTHGYREKDSDDKPQAAYLSHVANKRHTDIQLIPSYCDLTCHCV